MRSNIRFISLLAIISLVFFLHHPLTAGVIDQECVGHTSVIHMDPGYGQGFVPSVSEHVGIEVDMQSTNTTGHSPVTLVVHEGTLDGPVVSGSSVTVTPDPGHWAEWIPFAFDSPIFLTPGSTYVFEVSSDSSGLYMTARSNCYLPAIAYKDGEEWLNSDWNFRTWVFSSDTVEADIQCTPASGTLPFTTMFEVTLKNLFGGPIRQYAARIDVQLGGGNSVSNWKSGHTNLHAGSYYYINWNQSLPHVAQLHGSNTFTIVAEDVTPAPYNQPPYQPSGDTDSDAAPLQGY